MAEPRTFTATLKAEGPSQTIRGKIPTGLVNQLGGTDGDMIEFTCDGRKGVGIRILASGSKAAKLAQQNTYTQSRGTLTPGRVAAKKLPTPPPATGKTTNKTMAAKKVKKVSTNPTGNSSTKNAIDRLFSKPTTKPGIKPVPPKTVSKPANTSKPGNGSVPAKKAATPPPVAKKVASRLAPPPPVKKKVKSKVRYTSK